MEKVDCISVFPVLSHFSRVSLLATPSTVAHQAPLSMWFPRQGYWSGLPFSPPGDLPNPGIKPSFLKSPALAGEFFTTSATWEAHRPLGSRENSEHLCLNDVWGIMGIKKPKTVQTAGPWIDKLWPSLGLPGGSDGKESICNIGDLGSIPGLGRSPWRRKWQPTPLFLSGESHGQRNLAGSSPWGC